MTVGKEDTENDKTQPLITNTDTLPTEERIEYTPLTAHSTNSPESDEENAGAAATTTVTRGEVQTAQYRDLPFAILFYIHIIIIAVVAFVFGVPALKNGAHTTSESSSTNDDNNDNTVDIDYNGILYHSLIAALSSWLLSTISLTIMSRFAKILIQISLFFSIFTSLLAALISIIYGSIIGLIFGLFLAMISVCYACIVWRRIPFAAANLNTGLSAIKSNMGVTMLAYVLVGMAMGYTVLWVVALVGVYDQESDKTENVDCEGKTEEECGRYEGNSVFSVLMFLLLVAYYWSEQVIQNTIHVTVAGTVGTWWFVPDEASSCCSPAVRDSFKRSVTTSFGSICFGSLLVAIIQALRQIVNEARRNGDGNAILLCIAECLLSCIQGIIEYFNKWAYIYVGLYGYGYIQAGKNVMALFQARGWTAIIVDDLVSNTLSLVCLVIGLLTGCIGVLFDAVIHKSWLEEFGSFSTLVAFFIPFIIGLVISSVVMSVVDSAVNTVVVCFAESPAEFQENHPQLSEEMIEAWRKVYPAEFGF